MDYLRSFRILFGLFAFAIVAFVVSRMSLERMRRASPALSRPVVKDFGSLRVLDLVDLNGAPFTLDTLRGNPWVATVFSLERDLVDSSRIKNMQRLSSSLSSIPLVAITLEPDAQAQEPLKSRLPSLSLEPWRIVTGTPPNLFDALMNGFRLPARKDPDGRLGLQGSVWVLVDGEGRIRGYYDGQEPVSIDRLREDLQHLSTPPASRPNLGT